MWNTVVMLWSCRSGYPELTFSPSISGVVGRVRQPWWKFDRARERERE